MSNGLKGLTLAAGVIITCMVISIGFFIAREAKDIAGQGIEQMGYYMEEMSVSGLDFYEGLSISGSELERTVKRFYTQTGIWIHQKDGAVSYIDDRVENVGESIRAMGLNPHGSFVGNLEYDEKGKVKWLVFKQE